MKANELMVGDLVYNHRNWACPIVEIHKDSAVVIARHYGEEKFELKDLRPIPLTLEILEKNGLEKDNHGRLYGEYFDEDINQDLEITFDSKTGEVWWSYNWDEYRIIRLRYVHQLQHALKLCGIEKEIKL